MAIHVTYALHLADLPRDCIEDCSAPGPADEAVAFWLETLGFTVERGPAIQYLEGVGAWDDETLARSTDEELATRILWLACGDFSEFLAWQERNPDKPAEDADCGSDIFVLE